MADRGLYAPWLYRAIQARGWHPFLRVKGNLGFRASGECAFRPIRERTPRRGRKWAGVGEWSETGETIRGTLLACWENGYAESMDVVTDLAAEEANVAWYQMRFWIEDEYKDHKCGAFHWEQTKMSDPERAERWYLVMAVAMQAAVRVGGELEARDQQQKGGNRRKARAGRVGRPAKPLRRPRGREQSCLERGCQAISAAAVRGKRVSVGPMVAEAWPSHLYAVGKPPSSWAKKRKHKEVTRQQRRSKQAARQAKGASKAGGTTTSGTTSPSPTPRGEGERQTAQERSAECPTSGAATGTNSCPKGATAGARSAPFHPRTASPRPRTAPGGMSALARGDCP